MFDLKIDYAKRVRLYGGAGMNRSSVIQNVQQNPEFDVLVIGGGINGIGTFRDLALQGLRVLLVDKNDFCAGASAGSSHMLHGGIRYLENGEFRLVREALHERNLLLKNAAHYAKPLPTTIPIFQWFSGLFNAPLKFLRLIERPSERGLIVIKAGLMMYDAFTGPQQTMPFHKVMGKAASLQRYPQMNSKIIATATYYDAYMPYPERLCLDLIRDAEESSSEVFALNYVSAESANSSVVVLRDLQTGCTLEVQPRVVVNAAGPWIDFVNKAMGQPTRFIGGTKGSHLVLDHAELYEATGGHEIFFENSDGRIVLIFPYMGRVMIGTTDIRIDDPEQAECTSEEIDYMINLVKRVFPSIQVDHSHIVFTFTGVRPLPSSDASFTGNVSRDHSIRTLESTQSGLKFPIHSLIGGKWTTYRAFSEQATDRVLSDLGKTRQASTAQLPIGGGKGFPMTPAERSAWLERLRQQTELELTTLSVLLDRYGTYAERVATFMSQGNDAPLKTLPHYTEREVIFISQNEWVERLEDFFLRRSLVAMLGQANRAVIEEVGQIVGSALKWPNERTKENIQLTARCLAEKHHMRL
ncbi:MAG: glycerol-3-phosphate dehydrogenase/oxidase [Anaerolineae bacterium]|nr:glycerol-3-phosphate dehydrogenase/oxidase [Anaerolineae bacterium]MDW8171568.1 glycerol-3-phosphate dehydrogenase/oxidase [Anaerolineae bacterium]